MIDELAKLDRRLGMEIRILKRKLPSESERVLNIVDQYLDDYCHFYNLSPYNVIDAINKFSQRYVEDLNNFNTTGKLPYEINRADFSLSRIEYDLFLISSFFFTEHRFAILNEIQNISFHGKNILSVGVGSGIELEFLLKDSVSVYAYDLSISEFIKKRHANIKFIEAQFVREDNQFDCILAIELIEHLNDPYALMKNLSHSLVKGGTLVVTTIKNVPQFDHLYNFTSDTEFELKVKEMGLTMQKKIVIPHKYMLMKIDANNTFYQFTKE